MARAWIIGNLGEGLYRIRLDLAESRIAARIAGIDAQISAIDVALAGARAELAGTDILRRRIELQLKIDELSASRSSLRTSRFRLFAVQGQEEMDAWCADLTDDLGIGSEVATIEIPGQRGAVQIRPAFADAAAYSPERDGRLMPALVAQPANTFYNWAVLPGWLKWKPTARHGTLTAIDTGAHTGTVTLAPAIAEQTLVPGLNLNREDVLSGVPIQYMDCDSAAFEAGDQVLVEFSGRDWDGAKAVVGFKTNPKPCDALYVVVWANGEPGPAGRNMTFRTEAFTSSPFEIPEDGVFGPVEDVSSEAYPYHEKWGYFKFPLSECPKTSAQVIIDGQETTVSAYLVDYAVSILLTEWTFGLFRIAFAWDLVWNEPAVLDGFEFPLIVERFEDSYRPEILPYSDDNWKEYRDDALERNGSLLWTWQLDREWSWYYGMIWPPVPYCKPDDSDCVCDDLCHEFNRTTSTYVEESVDDCWGGTVTVRTSGSTNFDNGCGLCNKETLKAVPRNFWPATEEMFGAFGVNEFHRTGTQDWEKEYVCEDGRWGRTTSDFYDVQYKRQRTCPLGPFPERIETSIGDPAVASGAVSYVHGGGSFTETEFFHAYVEQGCNFSGWGNEGESPPTSWIVEVKIGYKQVEDYRNVHPTEDIVRIPEFEAALSDAIKEIINTPENLDYEWAKSAWYQYDPWAEGSLSASHLSGCLVLIDIVRPGPWADLVKLHNDHRAGMGLDRLTWNAKLAAAAQRHASDIAANLLESHIGSDESDPMERIADAGYYDPVESTSWQAYENIAFYPIDSELEDVFQGWLDSADHRATIEMGVLEEIGIAAANGSDGRRYYVVCFGQVAW